MTTPSIESLTDQQVFTVLALVLDYDRRLPDPAALQEMEAHVAEAATQPPPGELNTGVEGEGSPGALVRDTLSYLVAAQPEKAAVVERAIAMSEAGMESPSRIDPLTCGIGALVILALQTDVRLERTMTGRWSFQGAQDRNEGQHPRGPHRAGHRQLLR